MAAREIKTQLVLDGEKDYRAGLEAAYKAVGQLGRELKLTQARFLDNADGMEAQRAKAEVLRREIAKQEEIIRSLSERIRFADSAYEGNSEAQELYAQKIDKAMRTLARMKQELGATESAMADMEQATQGAARGMDQAEASTRDMGGAARAAQEKVEKLSGGFTVLKGAVSNLLADGLREGAELLKDFIGEGIDFASDLQEVDNVVSTSFKNATAEVKAFADSAAGQFGLSSLAAQSYAGKLGAAFNAMGLSQQAAEMSTTLTGLSGDLSSFWNITADEAYGKVFSGVISGETEGLKSLGIVMSDTNLQAFALTQGITKKTGAMGADEKALLRYRYLLNATSEAQGDFAKTSGSYANQMRIATLQTNNAEAAFGQKLLPTVNRVVGKFNSWMQSDYAKNIIEKTAEATGSFAEGSLTVLGTTLGWIIEHIETVKAGAASLGIGFLATKVTGFVMTMTNLVRTLKAASQATTLFNAALAMNPAVAVGIAVGLLSAGLIALVGSYQTLNDKLKNLKLNVSQASVDAVTEGINAGIAAADSTHEVIVSISADTKNLKEQLESFLDEDGAGGGKLTRKEYKAVSKFVNETVQADIDAAKKTLAQQKTDFQESLRAIVDDDGNSVFSEERAAELADGLSARTQGLIDELDGYRDDYIALAKAIYKDGRTPTEAEIENLNALLDKIGEVRIRLNEMQDSATQVLKARTERVKAGNGTKRDFGEAVGYVQQMFRNEAADRHADNEAAIAELQTSIDDWSTLLEAGNLSAEETRNTTQNLSKARKDMADLFAADESIDTDVFARQQAELEALFAGMAKVNPDAAAALADYARLYDQYQLFMQSLNSGEGFEPDEKKALLILENLKTYLGLDLKQSDIDALFADPLTYDVDVDQYLMQMRAAMEKKILDAEGTADNPLMDYLKSMLENGSLNDLDMTALDGTLADALKTIDLIGRGTGVGSDLVDGITAGIGKRAGELTSDDLTQLRDAVIAQTRTVFDSHSPARTMIPVGEDITSGLVAGMADDTALEGITEAAGALQALIAATLDLTDAGRDAAGAFADGMKSAGATVTGRAKAIALAARSAMYQYSGFYAVGQNNMQGFIDGLNSKRGSVTGTMDSLMRAAIQAAKNALDQHSPSRVFREIGLYTAMGYEQGFAGRMEQVEGLVRDRLKRLATFPEGNAAAAAGSAGSRSDGGGDGFHVTQNIYANETSYAAQQREAARQFRLIARRMKG